jgi:hypothetical protein
MNRFIVASLALSGMLLQVVGVDAQAPANRVAAQNQIVANEKAVMDAIGKKNPKVFHSYVAPDSYALNGQGLAKAADFDQMMSQCTYASWGLSDSTFYWVNESTVVHIYKWTGTGSCAGQSVPGAIWSSTVWANKGGKWLAAFHHESIAMPVPAATPQK